MALLRFFKVPKHQQYEYKPRFWDPKKEEMEERLKQIDEMKGDGPEAIKARLSSGLRRGYAKDTSVRKQQVMRSNVILLVIIVALVVVSYLVLTVYLPRMVEMMDASGGAAN